MVLDTNTITPGQNILLPAITTCKSLAEFKLFMTSPENHDAQMAALEDSLIAGEQFVVRGHCAVCDRDVEFRVDHVHRLTTHDGRRILNWRETLQCPHCLLNNRMRAAAGFLLAASCPSGAIYLTEAVSPLFHFIASRRENATGSEYLRDHTAPGQTNAAGIRHEDVSHLTFPNDSFDVIGSFEVLEHVPAYHAALNELFRCLRPSGTLLITVPFFLWNETTIIRATIDASGDITHLLPPEIHGDPLDSSGTLCFYHFGWDFMDALRGAGFVDPRISMFWDPGLGYLGGYQFIITTRKPAATPPRRVPFDRLRRAFSAWAPRRASA